MGTSDQILASLFQAIQTKNWLFVAVSGVMLVTYIAKLYAKSKDENSTLNLSQVAAGAGGLMGVATALLAKQDPMAGAIGGIVAGNAASGAYSAFINPLRSLFFPKPKTAAQALPK